MLSLTIRTHGIELPMFMTYFADAQVTGTVYLH